MPNLSSQELENLVNKAKAGDAGAFGKLYQEFYTPVFRYIYARTSGHKAESEDIAQTVFVRLWDNLESYSWQGTTPLAYCFRIARNLIIDQSRKKFALPLDESIDVADTSGLSPSEKIDTAQEVAQLKTLVKSLSPEEQELLYLRFEQELRHQEIAAVLGKSPEAVRQMQRRIVQKLRSLLSNQP